jgi:hypothetical protein
MVFSTFSPRAQYERTIPQVQLAGGIELVQVVDLPFYQSGRLMPGKRDSSISTRESTAQLWRKIRGGPSLGVYQEYGMTSQNQERSQIPR